MLGSLICCSSCEYNVGKSGLLLLCEYNAGKSGLLLLCEYNVGKSGLLLLSEYNVGKSGLLLLCEYNVGTSGVLLLCEYKSGLFFRIVNTWFFVFALPTNIIFTTLTTDQTYEHYIYNRYCAPVIVQRSYPVVTAFIILKTE